MKKMIFWFLISMACLAQVAPPAVPVVELGIDINGETSPKIYTGWPLFISSTVALWEGTQASLAVRGAGWTSALLVTVRNSNGEVQAWPLRLMPPSSTTLDLTELNSGEATWVLAPGDAAQIPPGSYSVSVTLDTRTSASPGAWAGTVSSRTGMMTIAAEPPSPDQPLQLRKLLLQADYAALTGDFSQAGKLVDRAIALKADHIPALDRKGELLVKQGSLEEAMATFQRALEAFAQQFPEAYDPPFELRRKLAVVADRMVEPHPFTVAGGVVNGASFQPGVSQGSWITIKGTNYGRTTRIWRGDEIVNGNLPTALDGVSVKVNGKPAFVYYISPVQINVQAPSDDTLGDVPVEVTVNGVKSASVTALLQKFAPAFFLWVGKYAVATDPNYSWRVKPGTFAGATTTAAKPGDVIILWGTGFGPTDPAIPAGQAVDKLTVVTGPVKVTIGGSVADYLGAALSPGSAGLYQIVVRIPLSAPNGDLPVVAEVGGARSPDNVFITVQN